MINPKNMKHTKDQHLAWWREARFGMMITWGIYTLKAAGEWVQYTRRIPVKEYDQLAAQFNPVEFNAREWVRIAKDAGMKYIVAMAKHHDGFAMFRSKVNDYNIIDATPFKRDPMAELAEACREEGIKFCLYFSHVREWRHPHAQSLDPHNAIHIGNYGNFWDHPDEEKKNLQVFLDEVSKPHLREILTQYNPALIWFDTPSLIRPDQAQELIDIVREICPECIINSRIGESAEFDYLSCGDNEIPDQRGIDFETPMVMNRSWGHNTNKENPYRTTSKLISELVEIVSAGGNFLLNVGPDELGQIPNEAQNRLQGMGAWLRVHGEAIYGTQGSPFEVPPSWGKITAKRNNLYLFVQEWQKSASVIGLLSKVVRCTLLATQEELAFQQMDHGVLPPELRIRLPEHAPDPHCSVIRVELDEAARIDNRLVENEKGIIELRARRAVLEKNPDSRACVSMSGVTEHWFSDDVRLTWEFVAASSGEYAIEAILQTFFYGDWDIGFTLHAECSGKLLSAVYDPPEGDQSKLCSYEKRAVKLGTISLAEGSYRLTLYASGVPQALLKRCGVTLASVHLIRGREGLDH